MASSSRTKSKFFFHGTSWHIAAIRSSLELKPFIYRTGQTNVFTGFLPPTSFENRPCGSIRFEVCGLGGFDSPVGRTQGEFIESWVDADLDERSDQPSNAQFEQFFFVLKPPEQRTNEQFSPQVAWSSGYFRPPTNPN